MFSVSDGKKLICSIWMCFLCPFKNVCFHLSLSEVDNNIKTFVMVKSRRRKGEIFYMDSNCKFQSSFHIRRKWAERLFHYGFTANLLVCVCLWNAKFVFQILSSHDLVNQFLPFALILPNNISFYGDLILQHTEKCETAFLKTFFSIRTENPEQWLQTLLPKWIKWNQTNWKRAQIWDKNSWRMYACAIVPF